MPTRDAGGTTRRRPEVNEATASWLLDSGDPWTRYRTMVDLLDRSDDAVVEAREEMGSHPMVRGLVDRAMAWPGYPLKRHNDAAHPLYAISTLADFGLDRADPGIDVIGQAVLDHFDGSQFETYLWLPRFLTKEDDAERWSWMLCDAPTLLYAMLEFGFGDEPNVQQAVSVLSNLVADNGWRCGAAESIPAFSGPGRKGDSCPMATTFALKALSVLAEPAEEDVTAPGIEALLGHWDAQADYKLRMFGIGTEFRKLRYPYVWYDILHVSEVLSRFPAAAEDERLSEMVDVIVAQGHDGDRFTASAMFRAWKDWSFADKREPSPWITFLVHRIRRRTGVLAS